MQWKPVGEPEFRLHDAVIFGFELDGKICTGYILYHTLNEVADDAHLINLDPHQQWMRLSNQIYTAAARKLSIEWNPLNSVWLFKNDFFPPLPPPQAEV